MLDQRSQAAKVISGVDLGTGAPAVAPPRRGPVSRRMSRIGSVNRKGLIKGMEDAATRKNGPASSDLGRRLGGLGLEMFEMEGDGNCQFRALADQLFGDQKHHAITRQAAVDHMRRHADFFGMYFEDTSELNAYLKEMGRSRTWGDELTLRAAVEAYGCCAHVITSEPANWYLVYNPEGEPLSNMPLPKGHAAPRELKEVFVTYISPIHYNAIRAVG